MKLYKTTNGFISLEGIRKVEICVSDKEKHTYNKKPYLIYRGHLNLTYENGKIEMINDVLVELEDKYTYPDTIGKAKIEEVLNPMVEEIYNILSD